MRWTEDWASRGCKEEEKDKEEARFRLGLAWVIQKCSSTGCEVCSFNNEKEWGLLRLIKKKKKNSFTRYLQRGC